jgi:hypothetical protein
VAFSDLQGALVDLTLLREKDAAKLHERLQEPRIWDGAGCTEAPDLAWVTRRLKERMLIAWEMRSSVHRKALGYFAIVRYCGTPFICLDFFGQPDLDVAIDCIHTTIGPFFTNTDESRLFMNVPVEHAAEAQRPLVDLGFDSAGELPGHDPKKQRSYVLERATYEIYYGEEADGGEIEELEGEEP